MPQAATTDQIRSRDRKKKEPNKGGLSWQSNHVQIITCRPLY